MDTSVLAELKLYSFDSQIVVKYKLNYVCILPSSQKGKTPKAHKKTIKF